MAGLYLHIPFCKQRCHYCNFFSVVSEEKRKPFLQALIREIELQKDFLEGEPVRTIYLGGGTPSLLEPDDLHRIFETIEKNFAVDNDAEITLEANPDDITKKYLDRIAGTRINRLSIGVQSFHDEDLRYLNRVHDGNAARKSLELALERGFENITIDLIYGIPTLDDQRWRENLSLMFSYPIPHLSAYALTVEERTALALKIKKGRMAPVDEEQSAAQFEILLQETSVNGFIHYEISNFSKEGYYSKHNSIYWLGGNYLGLGPSAHSYNGKIRRWNASRIGDYLKLSDYENLSYEEEVLTKNQRYNEYVMTSLRTIWGCDIQHVQNGFGKKFAEYLEAISERYISRGYIRKEGSRLFLTEKGKLFADGIASDLFRDN